MLRILIVGILLWTIWISLALAIATAAPYLAAAMIVVGLIVWFSKGRSDPPDQGSPPTLEG